MSFLRAPKSYLSWHDVRTIRAHNLFFYILCCVFILFSKAQIQIKACTLSPTLTVVDREAV